MMFIEQLGCAPDGGKARLGGPDRSPERIREVSGPDRSASGRQISRCGLDKPPGFSLKDAMVKIAGAKRTKDSSARQRRVPAQTNLVTRLDRLWQKFKALGDEIDAATAGGKPVADLIRKQEKLRADSWALADRNESVRWALAERSLGGARHKGNKPKAATNDF